MVGAGYFATFQLEGWRDAGAEVVGLCDLLLSRAQAQAERFGVANCFDNLASMLDALKPDVVDIVLPPQAQRDAVQTALDHGIPTICQKPFGTDLHDALAMATAAESHAVPLIVHENFRFMPWFRECRRLLDAGHFGRLHGITFRLRPGDGQGAQAYLDRQPYFRTMAQLLVRETGVHYIDTFRYLCGEVTAVTARLRKLNPVIAGEDAGIVIFEFADSAMGLFDGNRLNDHPATDLRRTMGEMWLEGERGVLRLDGDARLWWRPHHGVEAEHVYAHDQRGAFNGACTALQSHVLQHLQDGTPLENSARAYLANLQVQAAIYHSHASGRRVSLADFNPFESEGH